MIEHSEALGEAYARITAMVSALDEPDFARPTRAAAWTVKDLLFHLSLDAVRALAALATTTTEEADVDAVTYWRPFRPGEGDGGAAHARFVRVCASAYASGGSLVEWWTTVAIGAARAAADAEASHRVATQGHVLTAADFASTLLVEATIHHLDLTVDLPAAAPPTDLALAETRRVLEGILGAPLPTGWDDAEAALKGTGRLALTDADRSVLGDRTAAIPLLG